MEKIDVQNPWENLKNICNSVNKKTWLVIIVIVSVIVVGVVVKNHSSKKNESTTPQSVQKNSDVAISISQQIMRVDVLTDSTEDDVKSVYLLITPVLNIELNDSTSKIVTARIKNITVDYKGPGNVKIIHPKHIARNQSTTFFYTPISEQTHLSTVSDEGKNIDYKVVNQYSPISSSYDEFGTTGGLLEFRIGIQDVGSYNHKDIMKKTGKIESTEALKYTGVNSEDIDGKVTFTLELKLDNKKTLEKKFVGEWKGNDLVKNSQQTYKLKVN